MAHRRFVTRRPWGASSVRPEGGLRALEACYTCGNGGTHFLRTEIPNFSHKFTIGNLTIHISAVRKPQRPQRPSFFLSFRVKTSDSPSSSSSKQLNLLFWKTSTVLVDFTMVTLLVDSGAVSSLLVFSDCWVQWDEICTEVCNLHWYPDSWSV